MRDPGVSYWQPTPQGMVSSGAISKDGLFSVIGPAWAATVSRQPANKVLVNITTAITSLLVQTIEPISEFSTEKRQMKPRFSVRPVAAPAQELADRGEGDDCPHNPPVGRRLNRRFRGITRATCKTIGEEARKQEDAEMIRKGG